MWFGVNGLLYFSSAEKVKIMDHVCDRLKKKDADVEKDPKCVWKGIRTMALRTKQTHKMQNQVCCLETNPLFPGGGKKISVLQVYVTFDKDGIFKETRWS